MSSSSSASSCMPSCVRVDKVSPDVGLGLYYNNTTTTSIGDVLYKDRPLFHIQHTANRRYVTACQNCSKIIDNTVLQLQTILDEDAFREAQYQVYELGRESGALPDNNSSMVKCRCGEIYCSEECRVSAYKKHHWALCVADEATDGSSTGGITKFKYHCLGIDGCGDTLLLAAQVLAELVSSCEDNEGRLRQEVEYLMTYCHGEITKIARPPAGMDDNDKDAYNNWRSWLDEAVGDAYNLLADAFMSKNNELGYLLSDKCDYGGRRLYENIVGMFDMNNIDIEIHNAKAKMEVSELGNAAAAASAAANGGNANREMAATVTNVLCNILREKQVALSMWSSEMEGVYEDDVDDQEEEDNDDDMMSDDEHDDVEHEQLVAEELAQLREQARGVPLAELVLKDFPSFHGTGFYSTVARMNHSCCPNAKVVFNNTTNEMEVVSLAPIKYGDELRISYVPIHLDVNTRRHRLKDYGFYCNCDRCVTEQQQQV